LAAYFKANKKQYTWDEPRFKGFMIYAKDKVSAKVAAQIAKSANPDSIMSLINQRVNVDSTTYVRVERGLWTMGKNAAVDKYAFKNKQAEYTPTEAFPIVVPVGKVIKAPQEYTDVRGQVTTDYQDYLERLWITTLREKYEVVVNEEVLKNLE
jgi:peptidyl-prolyl cis-trans isomerase SurA